MQKLTALQDAKALFNRHGVTMIHDMSGPGDGEVFITARTMQTLAQNRGFVVASNGLEIQIHR